MPKLSHRSLIAIAGSLWFIVGLALLSLGLKLIVNTAKAPDAVEAPHAFLHHLARYVGTKESAAVFLIAICLFVGYLKGRFVLVKSVKRVVHRILSLKAPTSVTNIYPLPMYLLIGLMMGMGLLIKALNMPHDVRGAIDVAVGAALINGGLIYYRYAASLKGDRPAKG